MLHQEKAASCVGLAELQAYLRLDEGQEEALLAGLLRAATEACEAFTNQVWLSRAFEKQFVASEGWQILGVQPVRRIDAVIGETGEQLPAEQYRVDIDHDGRAFIGGLQRGRRLVVRGIAGVGDDPNDVPEPIRQGITRLAARMFASRDDDGGSLPAAVTALWRPFRRAGLLL